MTTLPGRRPSLPHLCVLFFAAVVVSSPGWSPPSNEDASDPTTSGSRMLAPGVETGVMRATPAVARAQEVDRSLERRSYPPLSASVPLTLVAVGLIAAATTVERRFAPSGHLSSAFGSRAPPSSLSGPTHRPA